MKAEYTQYQKDGLERLRRGEKCKNCEEQSRIMYCTPHGYWFMCNQHSEEWQKWLKKNHPRQEDGK